MIYTLFIDKPEDNTYETISLSVVKSFGENYTSNIPQHTVEHGYNISDTINLNNPSFTISGVITDSKFRVSDELVVYNGFEFVKRAVQDNRESFQQFDPSVAAEMVRNRLISLWENQEEFGILESKDINNVSGSAVRSIFPCYLTNLSFTKDDASAAMYPSLTIEKVRYSSVRIVLVENAIPELIPAWKAAQDKGKSEGVTSSVNVPSTPDMSNELKKQIKDGQDQAKSVVNNTPTNADYAAEAIQNDMQSYRVQTDAINKTINRIKNGESVNVQQEIQNEVKKARELGVIR